MRCKTGISHHHILSISLSILHPQIPQPLPLSTQSCHYSFFLLTSSWTLLFLHAVKGVSMKSTAYSAQSVSYSDMKSQFECCFVYNSLGPEQKCENISLLKIASLFPVVHALESDKRERERNWQNMFIISPICYPAVHSLDVTTFSYCFWSVHSHFDTEEGNYFFVLWNYIQ